MTPVAYPRWAVAHVLEPSVEPSARLRSILSRTASAGRAGRPADAVTAARDALDAANASGSVDDLALAHVWHATALAGRRPLGRTLTGELLTILAGTPDPGELLLVRMAQLDIARLVAGNHGETSRDLSVALNNAGRVQETQGNLDDAFAHYTESFTIRGRIHSHYAESRTIASRIENPETFRDLAAGLESVGQVAETRGNPDDYLTRCIESLTIARRIQTYDLTWLTIMDVRLGRLADLGVRG